MWYSSAVGLHFHFVFVGLTIFAFIAGLIWLNKYADKKDFLTTLWMALVIGVLGMLLTAPWSLYGLMQGMMSEGGVFERMMGR